jgi:hypothetical protein
MVRTARYKLFLSASQYGLLRKVRFQCMRLRNACLQELVDSYRAARRQASLHGRDRPSSDDWMVVRQEEFSEFLLWQSANEPDLRRRHVQAEKRRVEKEAERFKEGGMGPPDLQPRAWRAKDIADFARPISKQDQMRRLAEIRAADPEGVGAIPLSVLRDHVDIVHKAMDAFYRRVKLGQKPGFPRFKSFERIRSIAAPAGDGISFELRENGKAVLVSKMLWHGAIGVNHHRDLPGVPKTIRLTYDGRFWHVTIACEVPDAVSCHPRPNTSCGVDAGVRRLLTFDDGTGVENPAFLKQAAPEIRRRGRKLARAKRGSNARRKTKRTLAAAYRRAKNRRRTHHHKVALDVAARADDLLRGPQGPQHDALGGRDGRRAWNQRRPEARSQPRPARRGNRHPPLHDPLQGFECRWPDDRRGSPQHVPGLLALRQSRGRRPGQRALPLLLRRRSRPGPQRRAQRACARPHARGIAATSGFDPRGACRGDPVQGKPGTGRARSGKAGKPAFGRAPENRWEG